MFDFVKNYLFTFYLLFTYLYIYLYLPSWNGWQDPNLFQWIINRDYNWLGVFQPAELESFKKSAATVNRWTPAALFEAHKATKRRLFQLEFLPHIVAVAAVTPPRIPGIAMLGGGCALFPAFALEQFAAWGRNLREKSGLHVLFLLSLLWKHLGPIRFLTMLLAWGWQCLMGMDWMAELFQWTCFLSAFLVRFCIRDLFSSI